MAAVVLTYFKALKKFGLRGTLTQLYCFGQVKFGEEVGRDEFGNRYFRNEVDYPLSQNRWVLYKDHENPDATMVPPAWFMWLHAIHDEIPSTDRSDSRSLEHYVPEQIGVGSCASGKWDSFVGPNNVQHEMNKTGFHSRGYGIGSIYTDWGDDQRRLLPGDAQRRAAGKSYQPHTSKINMWSPEDQHHIGNMIWSPEDHARWSIEKDP